MNIFVQDCFHWIGFHIVNRFITNGYSVVGKHAHMTERAEYLSFFLGRNSLFKLVDDRQVNSDVSIIVNDNKAHMELVVTNEKKLKITTINTPLLFGKWMPMNETGIFMNQKNISFDSKKFVTQAVYMDDFTKILIQCLESSLLPSSLDIYSKGYKSNKYIKLANSLYIRDNIPIEKKVNRLKDHYQKYKSYYQLPF